MDDHVRWVSSVDVGGGAYFRVGRHGEDYLVEWTDMVTVRITASGQVCDVKKIDDVDPRLIDKILNYSIPAMIGHLKGQISFHGSAVVSGGRAFAFLGASGQGKSTLASALCLKMNCRLLADDITTCVCSEGMWTARGAERQSWLAPSARRALLEAPGTSPLKEPLPLEVESSAPLAAVVLLETADAIELSRVTGIHAASAILNQFIRLELEDPEVQMRDLKQIELLLATVPVFRLARPMNFDALSEVIAVVESMMAPSR